jgi:hypothetical protein
MNGSEEGEVVAAAVLSGAPIDLQARTVRYVSQPPYAVLIDANNYMKDLQTSQTGNPVR